MARKPPTRLVSVRVLTELGWITGTLAVPKIAAFVEYLESCGPFFVLTDALLPGRREPIARFLMPPSAALVIAPSDRGQLEVLPQQWATPHRVAFVLSACVIEGNIAAGRATPAALAAHVAHHSHFVLVDDARVMMQDGASVKWGHAIVNRMHLIGVADLQPVPEPDEARRPARAAAGAPARRPVARPRGRA